MTEVDREPIASETVPVGSEASAPRRSRRAWLLRGGIALVAVLVLVGVPGYLSSRPTFMSRYPKLQAPYTAWSTSVHAQVACQKCHAKPGPASQAVYSGKMLGAFYVSLVSKSNPPNVFAKATNASCRDCHPDWRTVSPSGDLKIPHRAHVVVLKLPCTRCHANLVHTDNPQGNHKPTMLSCMACHNGKTAKNACTTCHTNKAAPASHRAANWDVIHPTMVKSVDCAKCHGWTKNYCAECHLRRPRSHTADWRAVHGVAVKTHRDCEVCHTAAFCIRCHGEVPKLNYDPSIKLVQ